MGTVQVPIRQLRSELMAKCEELKLSPAERVDYLASLLDAASPTPELMALYENVSTKLTARVPIAQVCIKMKFYLYASFLVSYLLLHFCS